MMPASGFASISCVSRVEHDHVAVVLAPPAAEIRDVAALALDAVPAPAIEDAPESSHLGAQLLPGVDLRDARVGIIAVAQDEEIEGVQLAGRFERFVGRAQPGENAGDVLVEDRHHDRDAGIRCDRRVRRRRAGDRVAVSSARQHREAGHGGPEASRDPREQHREQHKDRNFQRLAALVGDDRNHVTGRDDGLQQHESHQARAPQLGSALPAAAAALHAGARRRAVLGG
jgi:hypothetical protein